MVRHLHRHTQTHRTEATCDQDRPLRAVATNEFHADTKSAVVPTRCKCAWSASALHSKNAELYAKMDGDGPNNKEPGFLPAHQVGTGPYILQWSWDGSKITSTLCFTTNVLMNRRLERIPSSKARSQAQYLWRLTNHTLSTWWTGLNSTSEAYCLDCCIFHVSTRATRLASFCNAPLYHTKLMASRCIRERINS